MDVGLQSSYLKICRELEQASNVSWELAFGPKRTAGGGGGSFNRIGME